jgi:hypothetical protein
MKGTSKDVWIRSTGQARIVIACAWLALSFNGPNLGNTSTEHRTQESLRAAGLIDRLEQERRRHVSGRHDDRWC